MMTADALMTAIDERPNETAALGALADLLEEMDDPKAPAARLAYNALTEPQKIGPKVYRLYVRPEIKRPLFLISAKFPGKYRYQKAGGDFIGADTARGVIDAFEYLLEEEAKKAAKRREKSATTAALKESFKNPYKPGDVFYNTWGYEQTSVYFAEAVAVGPRSVTLRRIGKRTVRSDGMFMSAVVTPARGEFLEGKPFTVRFSFRVYNGELRYDLPAMYGSWSLVGERENFHETYYG